MLPQVEPSVQQWIWVVQDCRDYCQDLGNTPIGSASLVNDYDPNNRALRKLLTSIDELSGLTPNEFGSALQANKLDLLAIGAIFEDDLLRRR